MIGKVETGFLKRSCSNKKMTDEHDSTLLKRLGDDRTTAKTISLVVLMQKIGNKRPWSRSQQTEIRS